MSIELIKIYDSLKGNNSSTFYLPKSQESNYRSRTEHGKFEGQRSLSTITIFCRYVLNYKIINSMASMVFAQENQHSKLT